MRLLTWSIALICLTLASIADAQPSVPQFEQALTARLLKLKPDGMVERNVLFQSVKPGTPHGAAFPFVVSAIIRDYGTGYPANHFYGETCISHFDALTFEMRKEGEGWTVEGRMTPDTRDCKRNPSAGVSAVALSTLAGSPAPPPSPSASQTASRPSSAANGGSPPMGEYACYGVGSRLMAGMGFRLNAGGKYTDVDGKRGGTYAIQPAQHTISFTGGFLDGQTGRNAGPRGFSLTSSVSCEPWK